MEDMSLLAAGPEDVDEILALQRDTFASEALIYDDASLPPLTQDRDDLSEELTATSAFKAVVGG